MIDSKKYLLKVRTADLQAVAAADNLQAAKDMLFKITPTLKDISSFSSGVKSKADEAHSKVEVHMDRLNRSIEKYVDIREEATEWLNRVLVINQRYYQVLRKRYFEYDSSTYKYKTLEEIAEEMVTSRQNIDKLHGKALKVLDEIMKEVDKS